MAKAPQTLALQLVQRQRSRILNSLAGSMRRYSRKSKLLRLEIVPESVNHLQFS